MHASLTSHSLVTMSAASAIAMTLSFLTPASAANPGRIDAYVTPYYDSSGPVVNVRDYSAGLAAKNQAQFVTTIRAMKTKWNRLDFAQLYVGAIRLYDLGYRREATYWFYTAQYKGRQFATLVDQHKLGKMGDPGFELYRAQYAFFEVVGPQINGYAFGDFDSLLAIVRRVQNENRNVPNMRAIYPGAAFIAEKDWQPKNAELDNGLGKLATYLEGQKTAITQQRTQNGTQARFAGLTSKQFPGGL